MRNGLALLLLGLTGLGLGTTSCGTDEATNSPSCKKAGESYQMVNSVKKGNCCTGLMSDCSKLVTTTDPDTGVTLANGSCTCVAGGVLGGGGAGGTGGMGGKGGMGPTSATLGRACTADAQCGTGLTCLTNNGLADGGPAHGICTVSCTTDSQCREVSSDSYCVDVTATDRYCLQACSTGSLNVPKCQQRPDVACTIVGLIPTGPACQGNEECPAGQLCSTATPSQCGDIVTGCVPMCGGNFDCGTGQFCDFSTGLCTNTKPTGLPIGSKCVPPATNADPDPCQGFCIASDDTRTEGTCTALCTFSPAFTGCGWDGQSKAEAACLYATILSMGDVGAGDVGICGSLCDCNADCALESERCLDETGGDIMALFGRNGYCRQLDTEGGETEADSFRTCPGGAGQGGASSSGDAGQGGA
jgi:hypothetical protein